MRKFKNLDPMIFADEYGRLQHNAFTILNNSFGGKYGTSELLIKGLNLVSKHFSVVSDNYSKGPFYGFTHKQVIDHFNEVVKTYYKILEFRKKKDMEFKLKTIEDDF